MPSALKSSKEHTDLPYKNHNVEFTLPKQEYYPVKNTNDESIRDSYTEGYAEVPEKKYSIGEKVSDMSYVTTSTPEPSKKKEKRNV